MVNHLNFQIMDYQRSLLKLCLNHHINIGLLRVLDFGHNKIKITKELENYLKSTFEMLITQKNVVFILVDLANLMIYATQ